MHFYFITEIMMLKEEAAATATIKAQLEKQLLNERTLKTQVNINGSGGDDNPNNFISALFMNYVAFLHGKAAF